MFAQTDCNHLAKAAFHLAAEIRVGLNLVEDHNAICFKGIAVTVQGGAVHFTVAYYLHGTENRDTDAFWRYAKIGQNLQLPLGSCTAMAAQGKAGPLGFPTSGKAC